MTTVALFNVVYVFFAYLARYKGYEFFLKISFFLIFLFLALRYNYGNDYPQYFYTFLDVKRHLGTDYSGEYLGKTMYFSFESGWLFLYKLFQPLGFPWGFFALVAVLAAFNCFVYYRFIKKYVSSRYYWFAVFLYVFDPNYMLLHSSAMRQSLAISIFLFSLDYLYKKDIIRYFLCAMLASLIHTSAYVIFPIYLLGLFNWTSNKTLATSIFLLYISVFMSIQSIAPILTALISSKLDRYEGYLKTASEVNSGLGIVYFSIMFALILFYERFQSKEASLLFKLALLAYFVKPLTLIISMITRIEMYFNPILIAVFPIVLMSIKNRFIKTILLFVLMVWTLNSFYLFFQSDVWKKAFGTYQTIFSSPEIY